MVWSPDSAMKVFVSAAFLIRAGRILSIWLSNSLGYRFSIISFRVSIEFLANCDLNESTSLINSLMTCDYYGLLADNRWGWYNAILLIVLHASNYLDQSPLLS